MCEVFIFPLPLAEAFIMSQHAQIGSVLHSWCTQIPLLSPVTKIWLENSFTDVHGPNPVIQHGALMQFHGYMESTRFSEFKAESDFKDVPASFPELVTVTLCEGGLTSLMPMAEGPC